MYMTPKSTNKLEKAIWEHLGKILDPELGIDLVNLGLIYKVTVNESGATILMTLTTPGCPLAHVFDSLVKDGLVGIPGLDPYRDVTVTLTFDPPWITDLMSDEAKAELGF